VDDLVPYEKNPRTLSEKQRKDLEASITKFNLVEIPAINTDNTVVAGHARLKIMQLLGRGQEEIEVRMPNRMLMKKEFEEYLLRSNRNTGSWNYELLRDFETSFLLDIEFDDADLSDIWDDVLEIDEDEFKEEDAVEKAKDTDIKSGDMFALGEIGMKERIKAEIERHKRFQSGLLGQKESKIKVADIDIRNYAKYILREGSVLEKRELLMCLQSKVRLANKMVSLET
jgi:hypothetical protein